MYSLTNTFCILQVNVFMTITSILTIEMTTGKLECPGYMLVSWTDEQLVWNTTDFRGISQLRLPAEDVWTPRFILSDGQHIERSLAPIWLYHNGTVFWMINSLFEGSCDTDMRQFPFDSHTCVFTIQPSDSDASDIEISIVSQESGQNLFTANGEWDVTASSAEVLIFTESVTGIKYAALSKSVTLSRRYLFKMIHQCLPLILICFLNPLIFLVPLKSGERITFSMTVLLTFVVFTSSLSEAIPHNSLLLSPGSVCMAMINVITTLAVITSVILCRMAHETIIPVPKILITTASKYIRYKRKIYKKRESNETIIASSEVNGEEGANLPELNDKIDNNIDWEIVANMFDSVMFYVNFIMVVLTDIIFISLSAF